MSKASAIIVLCEDRLQEVFVRRLLKQGWGIKEPPVRVIPLPHGAGAGEGHVRKNYPNQVKACRTRHAKTVLIVVLDADMGTVWAHQKELDDACRQTQPAVPVRQPGETIIHIIPKRHIETWLAYLDGVSVSEDQSYKTSHGFNRRESASHPLVDKLAEACRNKTALTNPPDSLRQACAEFDRIRDLLI